MITIYDKNGLVRAQLEELSDSSIKEAVSDEEYASIQFKSNILINFGVGDYIDVYSKRYWIMKIPAPIEKQSSIEYNYTIKFESSRAFLGYVNFELFDNTSIELVPEYNNATSYTTGNVVTYRNLFWQCTQNCIGISPAENDYWSIKSTITNYVPPYNASTTYTYGDIVEYNNNYFMYIYGYDASGNIPKEGDHWTIIKTAPQWDFSTVLTPSRYAQLIVDNMRRARPDQDWVVGDCVAKSPLQASFSNVSCLDAASQIAELFETELYVDGFTINFKKKEQSTNISMKYGENGGFQNITRSEVTESSKVTRLVALGGTQNILSSYRNGSTRLMLPNRYYLDSDNIDLLFPIEKTVTWDEIFPCMSHATEDWDSTKTYYAGSQVTYNGYSWDALQQSINVTPITGAYWKISEGTITGFLSQYKFIDANLTFNPLDSQYIMADGTKPKVRFITGNLAGYDFPIAGYEPSTKTITIEQISDSKYSSLPTASYGMKQGDQYVFIDLYMPQSYVTKNENRLLASAQEYLLIYSRDQVSYSGDVDTIWATNNNINLHAGDLIHVIDEDFNINLEYRIVNVTRGLRNQYEYQITLSTLPRIATRIENIENKLNSVSSQTSNNTINNGLVNQAVSTKLDKSIWDSVFEIRSDQYLNKYLFGKLPIALQYDFTTFAIGDVILPTLYDGLPIDGTTLYWDNGVLKSAGTGGTATGVSVNGNTYNPVDGLVTLPNYPTSLPSSDVYPWAKSANKPSYSWDEINSKPTSFAPSAHTHVISDITGLQTALDGKVANTIQIIAGTGLSGGGALSANRTLSLATAGTAGTYTKVTTDTYGRVINGTSLVASDIPSLDWSKITSGKPTTLSGYGITDAQPLDADLTAIAALAGTSGLLRKTAANTWSLDTNVYLTSITKAMVEAVLTGTISSHTHTFSSLVSIPTTIGGYGITDAYTKSQIDASLALKLNKSIWDTAFELRTDTNGTNYIYGKLPLVLQYDFSVYGNAGDIDIPSLYDGLPIDGTSLQWVGGVLKAVGGGGGLGTVTGVSVNGNTYSPIDGLITLPNYPSSLPASDVYAWAKQANKPSYAWDEIGNKPSWIGSTKPSYAWDEIGAKPSTFTPSAHTHAWSDIVSGKPTTISGYGIADAFSVVPVGPGNISLSGFQGGYWANIGSYASFVQYGYGGQLQFYITGVSQRYIDGGGEYYSWRRLLDDSNYSSYAVSLSTNQTITAAKTFQGALYKTNLGGTWISQKTTTDKITFDTLPAYNNYTALWGITTAAGHVLTAGTNANAIGFYTYLSSLTDNTTSSSLYWEASDNTWKINGDTILHSANYGSILNPTYVLKSGDTMTGSLFVGGSGVTLTDTSDGWFRNTGIGTGLYNITGDARWIYNGTYWAANKPIGSDVATGTAPIRVLSTTLVSNLNADLLDGYHYSDIINGNVASATKLQTARTLWGQSFDGTGNVSGAIAGATTGNFSDTVESGNHFKVANSLYGKGSIELYHETPFINFHYDNSTADYTSRIIENSSGTLTFTGSISVNGTGYFNSTLSTGGNINAGIGLGIANTSATSGYGLSLYGGSVIGKPTYGIFSCGTATFGTHGGVTGDWATYFTMSNDLNRGWIFQRGSTNVASIDGNGNLLLNGDFTVFSDIRKKDIQRNIIYSIDQISKAPLFEYTYKGDNVLRVGTSANYWAGLSPAVRMSGDFYTLNESALALVCSISLAKEFDKFLGKYETREEKQDKLIREQGKKIKNLEKRIKELEYGNI